MISRRVKIISSAIVLALFVVYVISWFFLYRLSIVSPMANLAYFHYGEYEGRSDKILYVLYYPPYKIETRYFGGSRYGIHWSDRKEWHPPTARDLLKEGETDEGLREIGFSEEEIHKAHESP